MTAIGIPRNVDKLGRIVIPKELRDFFNIENGTQMEIIGTDAGILIRFPEYEIKKIKEDEAHG